jgi:hypothetical protein
MFQASSETTPDYDSIIARWEKRARRDTIQQVVFWTVFAILPLTLFFALVAASVFAVRAADESVSPSPLPILVVVLIGIGLVALLFMTRMNSIHYTEPQVGSLLRHPTYHWTYTENELNQFHALKQSINRKQTFKNTRVALACIVFALVLFFVLVIGGGFVFFVLCTVALVFWFFGSKEVHIHPFPLSSNDATELYINQDYIFDMAKNRLIRPARPLNSMMTVQVDGQTILTRQYEVVSHSSKGGTTRTTHEIWLLVPQSGSQAELPNVAGVSILKA